MADITFNTGNEQVVIPNLSTFLNQRSCNSLQDGASQLYIEIFTGGAVNSALNQLQNFVTNPSNTINERENVAYEVVAMLQTWGMDASSRYIYILDQMDKGGGCCNAIFNCYGNKGSLQCCWNKSKWTDSLNNAYSLKEYITEKLTSWEETLSVLTGYQNDEYTDQQAIARINQAQASANQAIARAEQERSREEIIDFFTKNVIYVLPIIAVVLLFLAFRKGQK